MQATARVLKKKQMPPQVSLYSHSTPPVSVVHTWCKIAKFSRVASYIATKGKNFTPMISSGIKGKFYARFAVTYLVPTSYTSIIELLLFWRQVLRQVCCDFPCPYLIHFNYWAPVILETSPWYNTLWIMEIDPVAHVLSMISDIIITMGIYFPGPHAKVADGKQWWKRPIYLMGCMGKVGGDLACDSKFR